MGKRKGLLLFTQHVRRKDESSAAEAARQGENSQITDDSGLAWSTQQAMRAVPQDARSNRVWKAFSFFGDRRQNLGVFLVKRTPRSMKHQRDTSKARYISSDSIPIRSWPLFRTECAIALRRTCLNAVSACPPNIMRLLFCFLSHP
jgi:hypothetical protein